MYDDTLRPAQGILFAIAAGAVFWALITLLIWIL